MNSKLRTLLIINGLIVISANLLGPLYALFASALDITPFEVSLSWAMMLIAGIVTSFVVSNAIDDNVKLSVKLVAAGYLISAFSWLAYIAVDNFAQLLLVQAILGVGLAIGTAPYSSLFVKHLDKGKYVHDYADQQIISQIIQFFAVLAGGAILTLFGFNVLFVIMSLVTLLAAVLMLGLPKRYFEVKS